MSEILTMNEHGPGAREIRRPDSAEHKGAERDKPLKERVKIATETLLKYKAGKASLEQRVIEAERYYRMQNWPGKRGSTKKYGVRSNSGWLFNSCMIKHADAMDNYPEASVLPRESADEQTAKLLSEVLPCVLELNDFEELYDVGWWDKLIKGTAVYCVYWDAEKDNGIGDIGLSRVDILNCYWDPNVADIQQSRDFFCVALVDNDELREQYGDEIGDKLTSANFLPGLYSYETGHDTFNRAAVIDWYYKRNGILHYCKYVGDEILYASEEDERYRERGYYDHGQYPFVFDPLYPMEGSPAGFGQVDLCRDAQDYIDRLDSAILDSALINVRPKHFVNNQGGVNVDEVLDPEKPIVHVNGSGSISESITPFVKSELNPMYVNVLNQKINELRETSGSTAAAQGGASAGVTAYSAIAAMQEAASKPSRDLIRGGYRRFKAMCYMMLELMRQFYQEPRIFRITGDGQTTYQEFSGQMMQPQAQPGILGTEVADREPIFDIKVRPNKQTAYSRMAQNELAKELYGAGLFAPQNADSALAVLDMMQFEGKDKVVERVQQNGTLAQMVQQLMMQVQQLTAALGMQQAAPAGGGAPAAPAGGPEPETDGAATGENINSLGAEQQTGRRITAPRERANMASAV